ncbi:LysM peptidoglycan-binding domain-containing protein [Endozoicomonas sp. ALC020]|uniref:LysM peptidoglycan-binding domain-containing protein n=1 Tax=unclassified Endozoicomonas TaxID=2644528 RepID=UPI003BB094A5
MRSIVLGVLLLCLSSSGIAYESPIKSDSPRDYMVKKGDTLWEISNRFLKSPWLWPEIWHANPQIHNPHLIFPGDLVSLVYIDGRPRLTIVRRGESGRTIKLSPKVRTLPAESAIPAIPLSAIDAFLKSSRVFTSKRALESAPYIFASRQERIITGAGDKVYVRGQIGSLDKSLDILRAGDVLKDPDSGEVLGIIGHQVADASLQKVDNGIASLKIQTSQREVRPGDKVVPADTFSLQTTFFPRAPDAPVEGKIVSVVDGVKKVGQFNSVIINRGIREGLRQGDILNAYKNLKVKDQISGEMVNLPPERAGMIMIYRTFEKVSYGIVLTAYEEIGVGDTLKSP